MPEDAAIVDDAALVSLSPELASQVKAVREALQDALASRPDDALKRMSAIPRGSSLSEWRLYGRGLVDWLADEPTSAGEAWKRLDPKRRPGRIATTMMVSLRKDLEQATPCLGSTESAQPSDVPASELSAAASSTWDRFDDAQLYQGNLLLRVRFDGAALRIAEAGANVPEEAKELSLGPRKTHWLKRFIAEYGDAGPEPAAAMMQAALHRAYAQNYSDLFEDIARRFRGPRHDPHNLLLTFFYYVRFQNDQGAQRKADRALNEYLSRDLPKNESVSAELRDAIASHIHLNEALSLMRTDDDGFMLNLGFTPPEDAKSLRT